MNERIGQLAEQARLLGPGSRIGNSHDATERFAELIVRECVDKITTYDLVPGHSAKWEDIYDIHARLLQDLGEELKQHFGLKE